MAAFDRERTPPHWKREEARLKKLDDLAKEREVTVRAFLEIRSVRVPSLTKNSTVIMYDAQGRDVVRRDRNAPEETEEEARAKREEEERRLRKELKFIKGPSLFRLVRNLHFRTQLLEVIS